MDFTLWTTFYLLPALAALMLAEPAAGSMVEIGPCVNPNRDVTPRASASLAHLRSSRTIIPDQHGALSWREIGTLRDPGGGRLRRDGRGLSGPGHPARKVKRTDSVIVLLNFLDELRRRVPTGKN